MKKLLTSLLILGSLITFNAQDNIDGFAPDEHFMENQNELLLEEKGSLRISVTGEGVAPANTISPAQAYVMAKRAATVEAYRLIAEKVNGVRVEGKDTIKNMVVQRSTVKTQVAAMIKNASVVETTFKNGLCEVEMEIELKHSQFL
jgi:hypothetical protein